MGSHKVSEADCKLMVLLPQPPKSLRFQACAIELGSCTDFLNYDVENL
jgi:hypothetical protein